MMGLLNGCPVTPDSLAAAAAGGLLMTPAEVAIVLPLSEGAAMGLLLLLANVAAELLLLLLDVAAESLLLLLLLLTVALCRCC